MRFDEKPENQHYVPKMLLKHFCIGGKSQVHVYDKWEARSFVTNIDNIACERDFNVVIDTDDRYTAEPIFTFFEDAAAGVLDKLLQAHTLSALAPKDKAILATFVVAQYLRTKNTREGFRQLNAAMAAHIRAMGADPALVENFKEFDEDDVKRLSFVMLQNIPQFSTFVLAKEWLLLRASPGDTFYISDNPIGFYNANDFGMYGNLGFAVPGIQIYCPLSPNFTLALFCHSIFGEAHQLLADIDARRMLAAIGATAEIRANAKSFIDQIDRMINTTPSMKTAWEILGHAKAGRPVSQHPDNMDFLKYIQVRFSYRHVYSANDDFMFVEKVLTDHPDWKVGLMPTAF